MTCLEVPTPQSIYDEGEGEYLAETDIFEEIFDSTSYTYGSVMQGALWARYRYYMIGSCDIDTWIQVMRDRLHMVGDKWDALFDKVLSNDPIDLTDLHELGYNRVIKHEPISGTVGDKRTIKRTGSDTNVSTPVGNDVHTMKHEALPQTSSGSTHYYDAIQEDTDSPGVVRTDALTHNTEDTDTYVPNTQDTEVYAEERDLMAATFSKLIESYPDYLDRFADEFKDYFIQRW